MLAGDTVTTSAGFARRPSGRAVQTTVSPFVIVGSVNGRETTARAATPAQALEEMLGWLRLDENASAVWYLREDWPGTLMVVGRPAPGLVGETRRCAHLFPLRPGMLLYGSIVAHCGTKLHLPDIEWLNIGAGMPCECCLALSEPAQGHLEGQ